MQAASPTKYLYIVGRGHSGSTIFSMLMGQSASIASEGEIVIGFRPGYQTKYCANGEQFSESPFWAGVQSAFEQRAGRSFADGVGMLYRRAHVSQVPARLLGPTGSPQSRDARRTVEALYDSIAEVSGRPVVLDASKELSQAIFLLRNVPEAKLIHYVRSPFGVADSYIKRVKAAKTFHVFRIEFKVERSYFLPMVIATVLWNVECIMVELLRLLHPKRILTVHYEDLCQRPVALLERLEAFTGLSLAESKAAAEDARVMEPNHSLSANRLMREDRIAFSPKLGLPKFLTAFDKAIIALCAFPMAMIYGYFGRRAVKPSMVMSPSTR
jgi:hypothetical protein